MFTLVTMPSFVFVPERQKKKDPGLNVNFVITEKTIMAQIQDLMQQLFIYLFFTSLTRYHPSALITVCV